METSRGGAPGSPAKIWLLNAKSQAVWEGRQDGQEGGAMAMSRPLPDLDLPGGPSSQPKV